MDTTSETQGDGFWVGENESAFLLTGPIALLSSTSEIHCPFCTWVCEDALDHENSFSFKFALNLSEIRPVSISTVLSQTRYRRFFGSEANPHSWRLSKIVNIYPPNRDDVRYTR